MAKRSDFSNKPTEEKNLLPQKNVKYIHYTKLVDNPKQYCDEKSMDEIINLAWKIRADGEVLQPCLIRKIDTDSYELIAGHKRKRACKYLVEVEGEKKYEFVPCFIKNLSDARAEFQLYSSNGFHEKTDYEIMCELEGMKRLLEEHPEEFPDLPSGRMVEKLASQLNMKKSTVGEYLQIGKNLSDEAMNKFKSGELTKSAAVSLTSLPESEQNQLIEQGITKQKDIKAYKDEKTERTVHRTTVTESVKTTKEHIASEPTVSDIPKRNYVINTDDFGADVLIEEPMEGQYKFVDKDMNIEETGKAEKECPNCKLPSRAQDKFIFFNKTYCMNCIYDLLQDLVDTGVITFDRTEEFTKGIIVRS